MIAGDFNEGDGGRALDALAEAGFTDGLARLPRHRKTWRWGSLRARLDHLLTDERVELLDVDIVEAGRSDHLPVRATVAF